jgi:hypothetical protein
LPVVSIEEVRALVAERQRYDDWLAALEAKRADTPPRVFDRVRGDYLARRTDVGTRLQAHVGGLATLGAELEQRLGDLEGRLATHEEELAEGMLRNLVGEYDDDRWDAVRQEIEAKISTLGSERGVLLAEVEDVRALLASAGVVPAIVADVPDPVAAPTPAVVVALEVTPLVVPAVDGPDMHAVVSEHAPSTTAPTPADGLLPIEEAEEQSPERTDGAATAMSHGLADGMMIETIEVDVPRSYVVTPSFDTPAGSDAVSADDDALLDIDLQAMVDNPVPQGASHEDVLADVAALFDTSSINAVPSPSEAARAPIDQNELDDALAMFGEVSGPADQQFVQSLQGIEAEHEARAEIPPAAPLHPASSPSSASANDPFDDLAFLRSVIDQGGATGSAPPSAAAPVASAPPSAEPQKTLRCTECGTMNLPTEWYCERCGGELAAF